MSDLRQLLEQAVPPAPPTADIDQLWARAQRQRNVRRSAVVAAVMAVVLGASVLMADLGRSEGPIVGERDTPAATTPDDPATQTSAPTEPAAPPDPADALDEVFGSAWHDDWIIYADGSNRITAVRPDGTDSHLITQGRTKLPESGWDLDPRLSPDGTMLTFYRERPQDGRQIWVANADGSEPRPITAVAATDAAFQPTWTPDGSRIVYILGRDTGTPSETSELHSVAVDGSDDRLLVPGLNPEVSPDGTQIAYENEGSIWIVDIDAQEVPRAVADAAQDPSWSPDGTRIAYATEDGTELRVVGVDGTDDHAITGPDERPMTRRANPWWSADGRFLMAVSGTKLVLVEVDGDLRVHLPLREQWSLTWWQSPVAY